MAFLLRRGFDTVNEERVEDDRGMQVIMVTAVFLFIATLFVILRLIARRIKRAPLGADDYWIFAALVFTYGNGISEIVGATIGGVGRHTTQVSPGQLEVAVKSLLAAEVTWSCSIWCVKNSLLYLFIRVFGIRLFWFRAYVVMFIVALFGTGSILFYFLQCAPLRSMWDPSIPGVCGNQHAGLLATGIGNITTDLLILSLPVPRVWNMQVSLGSKAALTGIFGIGLLVCIFSVLRIISIFTLSFSDITYTLVVPDIWSILVTTLAVICGCAPVLRPIFIRVMPAKLEAYIKSGSNTRRSIQNARLRPYLHQVISTKTKPGTWPSSDSGDTRNGLTPLPALTNGVMPHDYWRFDNQAISLAELEPTAIRIPPLRMV